MTAHATTTRASLASRHAEPVLGGRAIRWWVLGVVEIVALALACATLPGSFWLAVDDRSPRALAFVLGPHGAGLVACALSVGWVVALPKLRDLVAASRPRGADVASRESRVPVLVHVLAVVAAVASFTTSRAHPPSANLLTIASASVVVATLAWAWTALVLRIGEHDALRAIRELAFPTLVGACAFEVAIALGRIASGLWNPLAGPTLSWVHVLLRPFTENTVLDADTFLVGTTTFAVRIQPKCAGYEGLGLVFAFAVGYLVVARRSLRFPNAFVLVPLGLATVWLLNGVRIAALIAVGTLVSRRAALGAFHSQAGWIVFDAVAVGLVLVGRNVTWFRRDGGPRSRGTERSALLAPFVALMVTVLGTSLFANGFDHAYPLRVLVVAIVLVACRDRLVRSFVRPSLSAFGIGVVAYVAWIAFGRASGSFHGAPVELSSMGSVLATAWIAFRIVGAVVTVPLAEELAFRGYVSDRLLGSPDAIPWRREVLAFAVSSVAFGLLHERVVAAVVAGGLFHLAYRRRRCVSDAVTAHAVTNALVALHVSATGDWSWWR